MSEFKRCDACKGDIDREKYLLLWISGPVMFGNEGPEQHFHNEKCLRDWLDEQQQLPKDGDIP